jgi:hypothetical protein
MGFRAIRGPETAKAPDRSEASLVRGAASRIGIPIAALDPHRTQSCAWRSRASTAPPKTKLPPQGGSVEGVRSKVVQVTTDPTSGCTASGPCAFPWVKRGCRFPGTIAAPRGKL